MAKFFRFLFMLIAAVAAAILILGVVEPTDVTVSRSVVVRAPKDTVFEQVVKFKNWPNWNPWQRLDSSMKITYEGTDGQPGSGYSWVGDENKVGTAEIKNASLSQTQMNYEFHVTKPWQLDATGILSVKDTLDGMEKVTWTMTKHTAYPFNAMTMFLDMDKLMGPDFENGLSNMKKYVESHLGFVVEIKQVDYPAQVFEGVRKTVSWKDLMKFLGDTYGSLGIGMSDKIAGPATGLFYTWDTVNKNTDVVAAFPVSDTASPAKGATFFHVGPAKAFMAVEKGGYSSSKPVHDALAAYVANKGQKTALVIEEYKVSPKQEPDSNKWVTNIYYLVQ